MRPPEPDHGEETQLTQPQGKDEHGDTYEPVRIPVPLKRDVLRDLVKGARPSTSEQRDH